MNKMLYLLKQEVCFCIHNLTSIQNLESDLLTRPTGICCLCWHCLTFASSLPVSLIPSATGLVDTLHWHVLTGVEQQFWNSTDIVPRRVKSSGT
jgi:hypothetical protein